MKLALLIGIAIGAIIITGCRATLSLEKMNFTGEVDGKVPAMIVP